MEKFEKVYRAMKICVRVTNPEDCTGCPYEKEDDCIYTRDRELLAVLETMKRKSYKVKAVKIEKIHI